MRSLNEKGARRRPIRLYWHNFQHKVDVAVSRAMVEHGPRRAELLKVGLNHELGKLRIVLDGRSAATQLMRAAHQRLAAANYRAELAGIPRTFLDGIQRAMAGPDEANLIP